MLRYTIVLLRVASCYIDYVRIRSCCFTQLLPMCCIMRQSILGHMQQAPTHALSPLLYMSIPIPTIFIIFRSLRILLVSSTDDLPAWFVLVLEWSLSCSLITDALRFTSLSGSSRTVQALCLLVLASRVFSNREPFLIKTDYRDQLIADSLFLCRWCVK